MAQPKIPEFITVHLAPPNQAGEDVTVRFKDYLKNVASSEIYPTWPDSALRANIYAQISFALNRIYTEWYRSRGYDFDITNNTQFDQKYIHERDVFGSVSKIVDEIFNNYLVRQGNIEPLFAQYCNGTTVTCPGLSQWGTVDLANDGLSFFEILQYYYGNNIGIVYNAPLKQPLPSYPGYPLKLGSAGQDVKTIQRQLNRIGQNYPAIEPKLNNDGFFGLQTEQVVKKFQEVFNLTVDGIVGKGTWYKIKSIYNSIKQLGELQSEGLKLEDVEREYQEILRIGDRDVSVKVLQYYLKMISLLTTGNSTINYIDGIFGENTKSAVEQFQENKGLLADGVVGRDTWNAILREYDMIIQNVPQGFEYLENEIYPGRFLSFGFTGNDVISLQEFINLASSKYSYIPQVNVSGIYDSATVNAVKIIQENNNLPPNGVTGPITWDTIISLSK